MKKFILSILLCICAVIAPVLSACSKKQTSPTVEYTNDYVIYKNYSYGDYGERSLYDVALPKNTTEASMMFFIHGGGWSAGSKDGGVQSMINANHGSYIYAALNYRYISKTVSCYDILDDITNCLNAIKTKATENGITVKKVAFWGHSAGGHLSLMYAYKMKEQNPFETAFVADLSGPTDLTDENYYKNETYLPTYESWFSNLSGKEFVTSERESVKEDLLAVSPISYIQHAVPTIIAHGDVDDIVPYSNAQALHQALDDAGVTNEFITFSNSGHGLDNDAEAMKKYNQTFAEYKELYL